MRFAYAAIVAFALMGEVGGAQTPHLSGPTVVVSKADQIDDSQDAAELLQQYATQVNSLVEAYQNGLQLISAAIDAGDLTPEQGQALADQGTRYVASRLGSFADLYESLVSPDDPDDTGEAEDLNVGHPDGRTLRIHLRFGEPRKIPWRIIANPDEARPQDADLTAF